MYGSFVDMTAKVATQHHDTDGCRWGEQGQLLLILLGGGCQDASFLARNVAMCYITSTAKNKFGPTHVTEG